MKNKRYRELAAILVMMTMTAGSITTVAAETDAFCAMSLIVAIHKHPNFLRFHVSGSSRSAYIIMVNHIINPAAVQPQRLFFSFFPVFFD